MSIYHTYKARFDTIFDLAKHDEKFYDAKGAETCANFMLNYYEIDEYVRVTFLAKDFTVNSYIAKVTGKNIFAQSMEPVFYLLVEGEKTGKIAPGSLMEKLTPEEAATL